MSILTNHNLSLYIKCGFLEIYFFCLFVIFHSYGDVTLADEGLQILTYARLSWPLSNKGSLACHTYCYTGHQLIVVS